MPLQIIRNDITKVKCDAIVNAANPTLLGGGGVDGAIHQAAGEELLRECRTLGGCKTGEAKLTGGYRLPAKYVIHTVGPVYEDGTRGEEALLTSCYLNSLSLAVAQGCESVAFPLISAGIYGYPKDKALQVAVRAITQFLTEQDLQVYLVVFDKASFQIGEALFSEIAAYIDDRYADTHSDFSNRSRKLAEKACYQKAPVAEMPKTAASPLRKKACASGSLEDAVQSIDESFSQMLLRKIDEKGLTDVQVYKKANIDRKLFSKIRSNVLYKPSKPTAIAFAVALELPLTETKDLLMKAGYALSHSNKFDIIIEYFITKGNFNIFEINEALFAFDQSLLGC